MRIYSRPIGNGSFRRLCKLYGEKRRGNGVTPFNIGHDGCAMCWEVAPLARLEIANGWYHVINRGHQREAIFRERRCDWKSQKLHCSCDAGRPVAAATSPSASITKTPRAIARHLNVQCNVKTRPLRDLFCDHIAELAFLGEYLSD
jgi:hypothetical protein